MGGSSVAGGMRPGLIVGSAAVVAVPLGAFVTSTGRLDLIPEVVLTASLLQFLIGLFGLTKYVNLVSESILAGFLNALSIVLFVGQLKFMTTPESATIAILCATISQFFPGKVIPASLFGMVVASTLSTFFDLPTLGSTVDPSVLSGGLSSLPTFIDPSSLSLDLSTLTTVVLPTAASVAFISTLETLLAGQMVDDLKCEDLCQVFIEDGDEIR